MRSPTFIVYKLKSQLHQHTGVICHQTPPKLFERSQHLNRTNMRECQCQWTKKWQNPHSFLNLITTKTNLQKPLIIDIQPKVVENLDFASRCVKSIDFVAILSGSQAGQNGASSPGVMQWLTPTNKHISWLPCPASRQAEIMRTAQQASAPFLTCLLVGHLKLNICLLTVCKKRCL